MEDFYIVIRKKDIENSTPSDSCIVEDRKEVVEAEKLVRVDAKYISFFWGNSSYTIDVRHIWGLLNTIHMVKFQPARVEPPQAP